VGNRRASKRKPFLRLWATDEPQKGNHFWACGQQTSLRKEIISELVGNRRASKKKSFLRLWATDDPQKGNHF
jgi:hypothetical protein